MAWIIYMHRCRDNGKAYIGKTCRSIEERAERGGSGYFQDGQWKFMCAIKKHGWDNFEHIVIEEGIETNEEACERERYYIKLYDSFRNGYNSTDGGDGAPGHVVSEEARRKMGEKNIGNKHMLGKRHSEETKRRLSETHKGMHNSPKTEFKKGGHPGVEFKKGYRNVNGTVKDSFRVLQYSYDGKIFIAEHKNAIEAARSIGIMNGNAIGHCCCGIKKHAFGYFWQYKEKPLPIQQNIDVRRAVVQMDEGGNEIARFDSTMDAERATGIRHSGISLCCKGKYPHAGGYRWKYAC